MARLLIVDDEEKILIANYRKALPEYQAVAQQILGNPENQRREKASSSATTTRNTSRSTARSTFWRTESTSIPITGIS